MMYTPKEAPYQKYEDKFQQNQDQAQTQRRFQENPNLISQNQQTPRLNDTRERTHTYDDNTYQQQQYYSNLQENIQNQEQNLPNFYTQQDTQEIQYDYDHYAQNKFYEVIDDDNQENQQEYIQEDQEQIQIEQQFKQKLKKRSEIAFNQKYYNRFYNKQEQQKIREQIQEQDIKKMANSKKISQKSYRLVVKKIEEKIIAAINEIDYAKTKMLTFEQFGRLLGKLEIFQIIQYGKDNKLTNLKVFESKDQKIHERKIKEMELHEQLWILVSNYEMKKQYVLIETVYSVLVFLLDPINIASTQIAQFIIEFLGKTIPNIQENLEQAQQQDLDIKPWEPIQLVKKFRNLNMNKFAFMYQNPEKKDIKQQQIKDQYKNEKYTHKPQINPTSLYKDAQHIDNFISKNNMKPQKSFLSQKQRSISQKSVPKKSTQSFTTSNIKPFNNYSTVINQSSKNLNKNLTKNNPMYLSEYQQNFQSPEKNKEQEEQDTSELDRMLFSQNQNQEELNEQNQSQNQEKQKIDRVQILYKKQELKNKWIKKQQELKKLQELNQCSFTPKINKKSNNNNGYQFPQTSRNNNEISVYDRLARPKSPGLSQQQVQKQREIQALEKEMKELDGCTFQPQLNKSKSSKSFRTEPDIKVNGFEKNVGRLRDGRDKYEKQKQKLEYKPTGEDLSSKQRQKPNPPKMLNREKPQKKPFLLLDINVAPGKTGRIGLYENDNIEQVAQNFCKQYDLKQDAKQTIIQVLQQQYDNYHQQQQNKQQLQPSRSQPNFNQEIQQQNQNQYPDNNYNHNSPNSQQQNYDNQQQLYGSNSKIIPKKWPKNNQNEPLPFMQNHQQTNSNNYSSNQSQNYISNNESDLSQNNQQYRVKPKAQKLNNYAEFYDEIRAQNYNNYGYLPEYQQYQKQ